MRTQTATQNHIPGLAGLILLSIISLIATMNGQAFAAGSGASPVKEPGSAQNRREQANDYFNQAQSYQNQENFKDAAKGYEKAIAADPDYAEAHSNLGYCYRKQKMFDKAIASYQRAIALNPKLAAAHEYIGEAYAETGRFDLADQHLKILKDLGAAEAGELEAFIQKSKRSS